MSGRRAKIFITLGPACDKPEHLRPILETGVDVVRFNMAHGDLSYHSHLVQMVRSISQELGQAPPALLADLAGPKIRVGGLSQPMELKPGDKLILAVASEAQPGELPLRGKFKFQAIREHGRISIDDGRIQLQTTRILNPLRLEAEVQTGGQVEPGQGVNFPGVHLDVPILTEADLRALKWAEQTQVDWLALSFVRQAEDLAELKNHMTQQDLPVFAKIETPQALDNLNAILQVADGLLVARGDLGVEIPLEELPQIQRHLVQAALHAGKPVVVATQLLDSMRHHPFPTRAEVTDVALAITEGCDGLLLTGETAAGRYPLEAIQQLQRIISATEKNPIAYPLPDKSTQSVADAIALAAGATTQALGTNLLVTMTHSGYTARAVAKFRPQARILSLTPFLQTAQRLRAVWGVEPIVVDSYSNTDSMFKLVEKVLLKYDLAHSGEQVVITAGIPVGRAGTTNLLQVLTIDG